jgi:hypothetical protein
MNPLLVTQAPDGSSLIVGEDPADPRRPFRLVFEHEGHGAPEPVRGHLCALWVTIGDRHHVVFAGDTRDEPGVDRVLLELPDHTQTCPVRSLRHNPRVWMSFPEPLEPGMVVTAWWLAGEQVVFEARTPPLRWGMRVPADPPPPPPDWPEVPSPLDDPSGWTGYGPRR